MRQYNPNDKSLLLNIDGAEELTGLSERSILLLCQHGYFPRSVQPMGFVLWRRADVVAWVDGGCGKVWEGISDAEIKSRCEEMELRYLAENPHECGPAAHAELDDAVEFGEAVFIHGGEESE